MLITTSGGMLLPGKDVQIERKCGDRTATAKGAGGENEAARRRTLSECASPKRQKTRIRLYLLLLYPLLSFQETNLDLSSHLDCDSPPLMASAAALYDAEYMRELSAGTTC
jgi:hypothetical protein